MNWILPLVVSNGAITFLEYVYRTGKFPSFFSALPFIIIPVLLGQWGLFVGFRNAPSLFLAGAVFTTINLSLRSASSLYIGEPFGWAQIAALVCMAVAVFLFKL